MLHKDPFVIAPTTFKLIQVLQNIPELQNFYLVGGTALALQLGHRNSIDIDLFTKEEFATLELSTLLQEQFQVMITTSARNSLFCVINNVKTDFVRHNYYLIKDPYFSEGIKMLSMEDIAAMKLHAIVNSGKLLKDFIDIYFLLEHFSMEEMVDFYAQKYPNFNPLIAIKAVGYFSDIDPEIDPPRLIEPLAISEIKNRISSSIRFSKKRF